jgi:N-acetylglutamate synthase-like GNAT family acetyltransferase
VGAIAGNAAMAYELVQVRSDADWLSYHAIRRDVLWESKGVTGYDDKRPEERLPNHYPLLLKLDDQAIGTTRLDDRGDGAGVVRLVAIRRDVQRQGHGKKLAAMVDDFAARRGLRTLFVNAAADTLGYYKKLGWQYFDWDLAELVLIAGSGRQMRKALSSRPL